MFLLILLRRPPGTVVHNGSMPGDLTCTVVVCTRDRPAFLTACLESLVRQTARNFEILVVDSAPRDGRNQQIAAKFGAGCVVEPRPGLSCARNTGLRNCGTPLVAFLDDDCEAAPDWLEQLTGEFDSAQVGAVTGSILMPDPEFGPQRMAVSRAHPEWFEIANFGGIGSGGNMAFRRSVFGAWNGFDERLGRGAVIPACEESYAFHAIVEAGHEIVYTPAAVVTHPHKSGSAAEFRNAMCSTAYMTLLAFETACARRVLRYCLQAAAGRRRSWRSPGNGVRAMRQWWAPAALLAGPLVYLWTALLTEPLPAARSAIERS